MNTGTRMTRSAAEAAGFTVDTHCYPWFGYKGPRFGPTEQTNVYTDLEADLLAQLAKGNSTSAPTCGDLQAQLAVIEQESLVGQSSPTFGENTRDQIMLAASLAMQGTAYKEDIARLECIDGSPVADIYFERPVCSVDESTFVAELRVQITPDSTTVSGDIIEQEMRWRSYDKNTCVTAGFIRRKDSLADVISRVREALDAEIERVLKQEGLGLKELQSHQAA